MLNANFFLKNKNGLHLKHNINILDTRTEQKHNMDITEIQIIIHIRTRRRNIYLNEDEHKRKHKDNIPVSCFVFYYPVAILMAFGSKRKARHQVERLQHHK